MSVVGLRIDPTYGVPVHQVEDQRYDLLGEWLTADLDTFFLVVLDALAMADEVARGEPPFPVPMSLCGGGGLMHMADSVVPFAVGVTVTRADIPGLCAGLAALVGGPDRGVVVCEVSGVGRASVVVVEALARLGLTARRHGWRLVVDGAGPELRALVGLVGLAEELPEVGREAEQREQPGGVEEVGDPRDPPG